MSLYRTIAALGTVGLAATLTHCSKVELCDRFPDDVRCSTPEMGQPGKLQVSMHHIPLSVIPGTLKITLANAPATAQDIFIVQDNVPQKIGSISTDTASITPMLRSIVHPGPAVIQVADQQVAVRLFVAPAFTDAVVKRPVNADLGTSTQQPASPTALGITPAGQIVMLGQYGVTPPFQGLKSYVLNGTMIDPAMAPNLSAYTGSRYPSNSGFALTATHIYFPFQIPGTMPTDIKQADTASANQLKENFFAFSALSLFTAEPSGQIIAAITTDMGSSTKKLTMFIDTDLSINTSAAIDIPPDPSSIAFLGAGDLDGDAIADLVAWDTTGKAKVYLGTDLQKISLKYSSMYSDHLNAAAQLSGANLAAVAVGDLDGDMLSDIALVTSTGSVNFVLNGLDSNFDMAVSVTMPGGFENPSALAIGNINMDSLRQSNDLIIANNGATADTKTIGVLVNQATKNWPN